MRSLKKGIKHVGLVAIGTVAIGYGLGFPSLIGNTISTMLSKDYTNVVQVDSVNTAKTKKFEDYVHSTDIIEIFDQKTEDADVKSKKDTNIENLFDESTYLTKGASRLPLIKDFNKTLVKILEKEGTLEENLEQRSIDMILYHTTNHAPTGTWKGALAGMRKNKSANFAIGPKGEIAKVVHPRYRSHGAGKSVYNTFNCNYNAINIEIFANTDYKIPEDNSPINDMQYESLKKLTTDLKNKYNIKHFLGHNQVAGSYFWTFDKKRSWETYANDSYIYRGRKQDPGIDFKWDRLGLENMYLKEDPDILSGRVENNSKVPIDQRTPGQRSAEKKFKQKKNHI